MLHPSIALGSEMQTCVSLPVRLLQLTPLLLVAISAQDLHAIWSSHGPTPKSGLTSEEIRTGYAAWIERRGGKSQIPWAEVSVQATKVFEPAALPMVQLPQTTLETLQSGQATAAPQACRTQFSQLSFTGLLTRVHSDMQHRETPSTTSPSHWHSFVPELMNKTSSTSSLITESVEPNFSYESCARTLQFCSCCVKTMLISMCGVQPPAHVSTKINQIQPSRSVCLFVRSRCVCLCFACFVCFIRVGVWPVSW